LNLALTEVADQYSRDHGRTVELVFGSSGVLTRQIRDGAPFDVFLSADESYVEQLAAANLTRDHGVLYALGRLALFAPTGSPLQPSQGLDDVARVMDSGAMTRFAIANPDHAPYGRAAQEALRAHGLWDRLTRSLVLGENVSQAAQFASSANTVGGLIAYSLALSPALQARGTFALIPEGDHAPLRQRMVLLTRASAAAEAFYQYLQSPPARAVLQRYGFALPA
jgi:molybdate transport system substrate-binding protein